MTCFGGERGRASLLSAARVASISAEAASSSGRALRMDVELAFGSFSLVQPEMMSRALCVQRVSLHACFVECSVVPCAYLCVYV